MSFKTRLLFASTRKILAPLFLRARVRRDELGLVFLAVIVGGLAGFCVWTMTALTRWAHIVLFNISGASRLSGAVHLDPWRVVLVPAIGGFIYGFVGLFVLKLRAEQAVDPIEANALHGGRMSLRDSLIVALQTFMSNGCGASLGLEAGFTQIAAAFGSRVGAMFRVRREDLRILVGCGAGGAIGAAFDAPMAGSSYAFELILGSYSLANIAPIVVATLSAIGITHLLGYQTHMVDLPALKPFSVQDVPPVTLLAIACALLGIAIMKGVAWADRFFKKFPQPRWVHPLFGGMIVGVLALYTPTVLSGGHAAMGLVYDGRFLVSQALVFLVLKAIASCISIGAGFRGGLFFASLYLGVLAGDVFGAALHAIGFHDLSINLAIAIGMASMATAIIGSPMAMVCLALEMTGDFDITGGVLLANILAMLTVRRFFGYSFATWRFHLRGETIRSALDVSWMRRLSVGRMMRAPDALALPDTTLARARARFPLGATRGLVIVDAQHRYLGIVSIGELHHTAYASDARVDALMILKDHCLTPTMNVQDAIHQFAAAEADVLPVVDNNVDRKLLGVLTEKYALRRYAEELDRSRRDLAGEVQSRPFSTWP